MEIYQGGFCLQTLDVADDTNESGGDNCITTVVIGLQLNFT